MINDIEVKIGPEFYQFGTDAFDYVPELLDIYKPKKVLIVHGTISWEKAKPHLTFLENDNERVYITEQYNGECSYQEADRIKGIIEKENIEYLIGVGGGKLADLAKLSGYNAKVPVGIIPTLASNCAPWAPLSVMYKENGQSEGHSKHYKQQLNFLLVKPELILDAPVDYFIAGIADTLAKWYESDLLTSNENVKNSPFIKLARTAMKICRDDLLKHSTQALEDIKNQEMSESFKIVSEIIIAIAGTVGGFGGKYTRNSLGHAMHDAISAHIPEVGNYLHGEKVAYGIMFQLAMEGNWEEIDRLIPLYEELDLPKSLTDMDAYPQTDEVLVDVVTLINNKEKVHLLPFEVNKKNLMESIHELEQYFKNKK